MGSLARANLNQCSFYRQAFLAAGDIIAKAVILAPNRISREAQQAALGKFIFDLRGKFILDSCQQLRLVSKAALGAAPTTSKAASTAATTNPV